MQPGRLRHRVTIQSVSETRNSIGEAIETWATFATVWARIDPLSGRQLLAANQLDEPVAARMKMRYLSGLRGKMRIVHGSITYNIRGAPMVDANKSEIELLLEEVPHT